MGNRVRIEGTPEQSEGGHVESENMGMGTNNGVPRDQANVEAEKGETMVTTNGVSNQNKIVAIGGEKHSNGGTPLDVPEGTIIYSDKLKIKDPLILKFFNESGKKAKTFAQLSKKYDITKWGKELENEDNDSITNDSLEKNLDDGNFKLSALFAIQEFHEEKGAPEQHSKHFEPFMERMGIKYDQLFGTTEEGAGEQQPLLAKDGMEVPFDSLPSYDAGGGTTGKPAHAHRPDGKHYDSSDPGTQPYEATITEEGRITPTGKLNFYSQREEPLEVYFDKWSSTLGKDVSKLSEKQLQAEIYDWSLKKNPEAIRNMWLTYGLTAKGEKKSSLYSKTNDGVFEKGTLSNQMLADLKSAFVDGHFGVRQMDPLAEKIDENTVIERIDPDAKVEDEDYDWELNNSIDGRPKQRNMDFRWDHKRALAQAVKNKTKIPRLAPFTPIPRSQGVDQIYYNPDQAIASIQSMVSNAGTKQAMFAPQQQQVSNFLAGQQFELMGKVIGQYEDKNVAAYNRESLTNTQIANRSAERLAGAIQGHHDKTTTLQQEYANARTNADNNIAENEIAMWNERRNRMNLEATIGEQFVTDPNTGLHRLARTKDLGPGSGGSQDIADIYSDIQSRVPPGTSSTDITRMAMAVMKGDYTMGEDIVPNKDNYTS